MKKWILAVLSLAMGCNPVLAYSGLQQKSTGEQVFDFLHNNQTVLKVGLAIGIVGFFTYVRMRNIKKAQKLKEEQWAAEYSARMREQQRRREELEREAARLAAHNAEERQRRERRERERQEREAQDRQWEEALKRVKREADERRQQREQERAERERERAERQRKLEEELKRAEELRREKAERERKRKNEDAWRCSHEFEENLRNGFKKEREKEEKKRKEAAAKEEAEQAWRYFQEQARRNWDTRGSGGYTSSSSYEIPKKPTSSHSASEDPTIAAYRKLGVQQNADCFAIFGLPYGTSKERVKKKHIELTKKFRAGLATDANSDSAYNVSKEIMQIINSARDQCFEYFDGRKEVSQETAEDVRRHKEEQRRRFTNNTF